MLSITPRWNVAPRQTIPMSGVRGRRQLHVAVLLMLLIRNSSPRAIETSKNGHTVIQEEYALNENQSHKIVWGL